MLSTRRERCELEPAEARENRRTRLMSMYSFLFQKFLQIAFSAPGLKKIFTSWNAWSHPSSKTTSAAIDRPREYQHIPSRRSDRRSRQAPPLVVARPSYRASHLSAPMNRSYEPSHATNPPVKSQSVQRLPNVSRFIPDSVLYVIKKSRTERYCVRRRYRS